MAKGENAFERKATVTRRQKKALHCYLSALRHVTSEGFDEREADDTV